MFSSNLGYFNTSKLSWTENVFSSKVIPWRIMWLGLVWTYVNLWNQKYETSSGKHWVSFVKYGPSNS